MQSKLYFLVGLLLVSAGAGIAQPGATGSALAVEHSVPFGTVPGKLLLLGDYLVFVDEQQLSASFVVPKSAVETLNAEGSEVTVQTREPVRNRSGQVNRLSFRVGSGADPAVVTGWYGSGSAVTTRGGSASPSATSSAGPGIYQAHHDHRIGECRGRLIVTSEQVSYESVSSISHSRRWEYRAIKEIKLSNPYEIEIEPFTGDTYKLRFDGAGMDPAAFKELVDRVTSARGK